jgi:proteasome lid subunit RPN8/RPN11
MESVSVRIEINASLAPATVPSAVLHEICRHALEVIPEECCGLVIGNDAVRFLRTVRVTNVMTKMHLADPATFPRDAHHAYYMSEIEYQRALEEAEAREERVSAVYHSHVGQGCYLSEDDLAFAAHPLFPFPDAAQIVVSLLEERVDEVGLFEPVAVGMSAERRYQGRRLEAIA